MVALLCHGAVFAQGRTATAARFAVANVHLEENATDGDAEVVIEAMGGADGLTQLVVKAPDGRTVVQFTAPDGGSVSGMRQFRFESPEPTDVSGLKAAYPPGMYAFDGVTARGAQLHGTATLNHALPGAVSLVTPKEDAVGVALGTLEIRWEPVAGATAYQAYIEQDEFNVSATLPGSATTFAIPDGFLRPGTEYQLGVGVVSKDGNISFIETTFTTKP
jgi:hypothetical protein